MDNTRGLWVAVFLTAGLVIGTIGGVLAWLGGFPIAIAILMGAGGLVGTVGLALTVATFLMRA